MSLRPFSPSLDLGTSQGGGGGKLILSPTLNLNYFQFNSRYTRGPVQFDRSSYSIPTAPFPQILISSDFPNPISRPRGVRDKKTRGSERQSEGDPRANPRGARIREAIGFDESETPSDLRVSREATGY